MFLFSTYILFSLLRCKVKSRTTEEEESGQVNIKQRRENKDGGRNEDINSAGDLGGESKANKKEISLHDYLLCGACFWALESIRA